MSEVVGERVRMFREAKGVRQEDIANEARKYGFSWGRSSVAALEAGNRDLSVAEFLLLPSMIKKLGGWDEPLIPPTARIRLNENLWIQANQIPSFAFALLAPSSIPDHPPLEEEEDLGVLENDPAPESLSVRQQIARRVVLYEYILLKLWPEQRKNMDSYSIMHSVEIAKKVADRISTPNGTSPPWQAVQVFSWGLWGRSIGDERDARTKSRGDYTTKRALQSARGHVTRELIEELQAAISERWGEVQQAEERMESLIGSNDGMEAWEDEVSKMRHPEWYPESEEAPPARKGFLRRRRETN